MTLDEILQRMFWFTLGAMSFLVPAAIFLVFRYNKIIAEREAYRIWVDDQKRRQESIVEQICKMTGAVDPVPPSTRMPEKDERKT